MLKNYRGFSLLESAAAFSIWCMAVLTLLPGIVHILQERENSRLEIQFIKILQLHVQEGELGKEITGAEGGVRYEIKHLAGENCIAWKTKQGENKKFCFQVH